MQHSATGISAHQDLKLLVLILILTSSVFHIGLALSGRGIGRDQHLGTAVEYAKTEIDLLRPVILGANANGVPTPLEFPIWQASVALLMKLFGHWNGWGNVVSLAFHFLTLWPVFHLAQGLFSTRVGWWALFIYLAQPLTFLWGGTASADSMSGGFAIWFVFLCWQMIIKRRWVWWPGAVFAGSLSATTKAPFFFVAGLTTLLWLLHEHRRSAKAWMQLASAGVVSVLFFIAWNHHANRCYAMAELPYVDLRVGKDAPIMAFWFSDSATRLNPKNWLRGAWRASAILLGSIGLIFLPSAGLFLRGAALLRWWLVGGLAALAVFTNLILIHWHYYYIFSAPVALLCARAVGEFEPAFWRCVPSGLFSRVTFCGLVAFFCLAQGLQAAHLNLYLDPYPRTCAAVIKEHTISTDKLVVWGGGWTTPLLHANREGVSISNFDPITSPEKLLRLRQLGYNKLVLMNAWPLLVAINNASGTGGFAAYDLRNQLPSVAQQWPVRFESPSVLILEIPE